MKFLRHLNPKPGIVDFWHEFRRPNPHRWPILAVSACITGTIIWMVAQEDVIGPPERPTVTYITSFAEGRTDEEIAASNRANQERQDARRAEQERRAERRKDLYRALGRATGVDVDEMEREIAAEEAEIAAREAAEEQALRSTSDAASAATPADDAGQQ